ncbi:MAG TPA: hypothetical protein VMU15_13665 [Anaeromyxobacter sp.]|nr:hypothetical protein [Anaeromyxobacter sp.]
MTTLDGTLGELARLRSTGEPIVSLYLDVRFLDGQQRGRIRLFLQDGIRRALSRYPPGAPGREGLAGTLEDVREYVSGLLAQKHEPGKNGLALFASRALGLWRPHFFRRAFQPELCTDHIPHLAQLVRLSADREPAIVVVPGPEGADIYQLLLGDLAVEESLRGFVPRRERDEGNPGEAQHGRHHERVEKDDRHAEAHVLRNRRLAAAQAATLFDRTPGAHLVLVGTSEAVAAFERELPERMRAAVVARLPRPREWESGEGPRRDGVVSGAAVAMAAHGLEVGLRSVERVVGESLRGGPAVLGPEDVVLALNEGRVQQLVLEEDFARAGWRCTNCDALGASAPLAQACPYCAGALAAVGDLGEAMVARALGEGGGVEVVPHSPRLHGHAGVAAFLRRAPGRGRGAARGRGAG